MQVVNLFGGPGSGKSTTAAGLFYEMKMAHIKVELVIEYAKDLYYSGTLPVYTVNRQEVIFAEQNFRIERLKDHVDFAIVDSPLMLSFVYGSEVKTTQPAFLNLVSETFKSYDNVNFFIHRPSTFQDEGRMQNEQQSIDIDNKILNVLGTHNIPLTHVNADSFIVRKIMSHLGV